MGMSCVWDSNRGFGERSWRYSAVINNLTVEKLFVEVFKIFSIHYYYYYCRAYREVG
jgi:peroxiredoxin